MHPVNASLFWKVWVINGAVLVAGTVVLVVSPARVSRQPVVSEAVVLVVGLGLMLVANAALLRSALAPVDRVIREMQTVRLGGAGRRVGSAGSGPGGRLVLAYHAMLERLEGERAASNANALAAQEAERHRIAQELHDQVGQSLTVVLLGLKELGARAPAGLREELDMVRETARVGLDDVRRVARELRPGVLHDLGLLAALSALGTDVAAHGGPVVRRTFGRGLPDLGHDAELVIYRVAQEALTNAARHARATRVELSLVCAGEQLVLEVRDDGRGFEPGPALPDGAGLTGMRDRAALVGGSVEVVSTVGAGTIVRLRLPTRDGPR